MDSRGSWGQPVWAVLFTTLLLGATSARATEGDDDDDEGYQSGQGTHLHGTVNDKFERVAIPLNSATSRGVLLDSVKIEAGQLLGTKGNASLSGYQFIQTSFSTTVNNQVVTFTIRDARPHRNVYTGIMSATVWDYFVDWSSPAGRGTLCPNGAPALVLPGFWLSGAYVPESVSSSDLKRFSFACQPTADLSSGQVQYLKGGVAAKCVDWGYPPWVSQDAMPDGRINPTVLEWEAWRNHVACTGMASADYCGEAKPNTIDGTPIVMFDAANVKTMVVDPSKPPYVADGPFGGASSRGRFFFEAAWTAVTGNDPVTGVRGISARAVCLTKRRWSTLPLNGACVGPQVVKDPRDRVNEMKYCDEMSAADLQTRGARLYSYSAYIDAGLYRFKKKGTTDQFITTTSVSLGHTFEYELLYRPVGFADADQYVLDADGFEGSILSSQAPASFQGLKLTSELRNFTDGAGHYTLARVDGAPKPLPSNYFAAGSPEGFVYTSQQPPPPNGAPALHLWWKESTSTYVTTRKDLSAQGYTDLGVVGFLPALRDYDSLTLP